MRLLRNLGCILFFVSMVIPGIATGAMDVTPGFSVSEEYTDNVDLTKEDMEEEFITLYSPFVILGLQRRKLDLSLSYRPTYADYKQFNENDGWRHRADLSLTASLSRRSELTINDSFLLTDDPVSEADTTVRRDRQTYYTNTSSIGITFQLGAMDSVNAEYSYSFLRNEDEAVEDNQSHNGTIGLEYWLSPNSIGMELYGNYIRGIIEDDDDFDTWTAYFQLNKQLNRHFTAFGRYTHTFQKFDGNTSEYQIYDPAAGIDYRSDDEMTFSIAIGYYYRDFNDSDNDDRGSVSVVSDIDKTWERRRSSVTLTGSSGYTESLLTSERLGFTVFYMGHGSFTYRLTRDLNGNLFASHTRNDFLDTDEDRIDNLSNIGIGMDYQILTWLSTNLTYTYRIFNSTVNDDDYIENRLFLNFTIAPSHPVRLTE